MAVSLYDVVLFLHLAAAIHLLGTAIVSPMLVSRIGTAATRSELLSWLGFLRGLTRFNPLSAFVLLLSGIYLGSAGWWATGWFYVSAVAWVVSSALAGAVLKPTGQRIAQAAAADVSAPIDAALDALRHARGWKVAEKVMLGSDVAMLWIMVAKPSLVVSVVLLLVLMAVFASAGVVGRKPALAS